ncbi:histidine kinase [Robbsia sp. Bb-Pol-6]|uniref:Histidine kinase n=1 Tax=Robbsia betulipollinis TaxID=2981849 RepID=A0ABT3ZTF2_9BURK|nr:histidine kinase [Robbsia betulipollinis]MCY0389864.1 histidine kinase [Robbsia betulipollinis]
MAWQLLFSPQKHLTVQMPSNLNRESMYRLVASVLDRDHNARCATIYLDFEPLKFIDPAGVTVLSNLIEFLRKVGAKTYFKGHKDLSTPVRFLDDSGFFEQYLGYALVPGARIRATTLPLQLVEYQRSYEYLEYKLIPWLANVLGAAEPNLSTIKVCFQEIFNNINDHSEVKIGCVFAQHYPKNHTVQITVSDFGVGIPHRIQSVEPQHNDQQALRRAAEQGFTTQTTIRNRGAGLDVLIKNVVSKNGGAIIIQSGGGILSCTRGPDGTVKRTPRSAKGFYPGTLIQMSLHTKYFISDELDEEFSW